MNPVEKDKLTDSFAAQQYNEKVQEGGLSYVRHQFRDDPRRLSGA